MSGSTSQQGKDLDTWIGEVIHDKYRIDRKLGEGGMGAVYEGEHTLIGRRVAVKLLRPEISRDEHILARFQREARAATSIGHEHIVEVTDMGKLDDGSAFMVLEYLEGRDMGEEIECGLIPVKRLVHIIDQTCDALTAAHAKGIVHRDLKPANIFLIKKGADPDFVKVLDFGIAKHHTGEEGEASLTQTGVAMGTPAYMAPEQAQSVKNVDHRADIYSIGVVIFEALTGQKPFVGETFVQIMVSLVCDPAPPLRQLRPDLPFELEEVVARLLTKTAAERYQTCESIKAALAPFADLEDTPPDEVPLLGPSPTAFTQPEGGSSGSPTAFTQPEGLPQSSPTAFTQPEGVTADGALERGPATGSDVGESSSAADDGAREKKPRPIPETMAVRDDSDRREQREGKKGGKGKTFPMLLAGVIGVTTLVVGGLLLLGVGTEGETPSSEHDGTVRVVDDASSRAVDVKLVRVQIETTPVGAELYLDGEPIANPFDAELPQQIDPRQIEARLEGFQTVSKALSLRYPQRVRLELLASKVDPPSPVQEADSGTPDQGAKTPPPVVKTPRSSVTKTTRAKTRPAAPAQKTAPQPAEQPAKAPVVEKQPPVQPKTQPSGASNNKQTSPLKRIF